MRLKIFLKRPEFTIIVIVSAFLVSRPLVRYSEGFKDSAAYVFGSETIASGRFYQDSALENFRIVHCVLKPDKFYSRFFPGTLLSGGLGIRLFSSWYVINILLLGGILYFLSDLCRKTGANPILGWLPLCLIGIFIDLPNEVFSLHSILHSTFWTILFIWSLYRGLIQDRKVYYALAGFAIGFSAITRPMLPAFLIIITGSILLFQAFRSGKKGWTKLLFFSAPVVLCALFQMFYNHQITGEWLTLPWSQYDPHSDMGFGLRGDHFSGDYTMFTMIDVLRNFRSIIWGEFAILIPLLVSMLFLAWCLMRYFDKPASSVRNNHQAVHTIAFIMSLGAISYIIGMCFFFWGLKNRYYYLEVNCFVIVFLAIIAGWIMMKQGSLARKTAIAAMIMLTIPGLFETAYGFHIGMKTTSQWKVVFEKLERISGGEETLFILHKNDVTEDPGKQWSLGNYRTQYFCNTIDTPDHLMFALSLGDADRELERVYSENRKIVHIVVNRLTGMVKEWDDE